MKNYGQNLEYGANLELIFPTRIASPVYTGSMITGEDDGDGGKQPINIMLVDRETRQQVTNGRTSSLKVKIVLIRGDFGGVIGDEGIWTPLEFSNNIVINFGKKKNLLLGDLTLILKNGSGTIGHIRIKHDRNPLRNVKFRLGAMVDADVPYAIKEAITNSFDVKDCRNKSKHTGQLSPNDMAWQLVNISKKGPIRKRLESKQVWTIKDFLSMYYSNPRVLKEISGMKGKKWEMTINHAKTSLVDNLCNAYGRVGSTSQQSNTLTSLDYYENIKFNYNCYKPQLCEKDHFGNMMIADCNFSVQDVEVCDVFFLIDDALAHNDGCLAKKRWMKLRAILWFLMSS